MEHDQQFGNDLAASLGTLAPTQAGSRTKVLHVSVHPTDRWTRLVFVSCNTVALDAAGRRVVNVVHNVGVALRCQGKPIALQELERTARRRPAGNMSLRVCGVHSSQPPTVPPASLRCYGGVCGDRSRLGRSRTPGVRTSLRLFRFDVSGGLHLLGDWCSWMLAFESGQVRVEQKHCADCLRWTHAVPRMVACPRRAWHLWTHRRSLFNSFTHRRSASRRWISMWPTAHTDTGSISGQCRQETVTMSQLFNLLLRTHTCW